MDGQPALVFAGEEDAFILGLEDVHLTTLLYLTVKAFEGGCCVQIALLQSV